MEFGKYMTRLVNEKPKEQRWGQWAMNLAHEMSDKTGIYKIDQITKGGITDCWEVDNMNDEKFKNFIWFIMK